MSAALAAVTLAAGGEFDYAKLGADWDKVTGFANPTWVNECGTGREQSPIDLVTAEVNDNLDIDYQTTFNQQYGSLADANVERKKYTWQPGWGQGAFTKTFEDGSTGTF